MVGERTNRITTDTLVLTVAPPYITWTVRPILNKRVLTNVLRNMLEIFGAVTFLTSRGIQIRNCDCRDARVVADIGDDPFFPFVISPF